MNANALREERQRLRARLRRDALDQIGQDQVLDMEHLVSIMADPFGTHRTRLISRRLVGRGLVEAGATAAQVGVALDLALDDVTAWTTAALFAPPAVAAAVERAVVEQLPARLINPEHVESKDRELARTNPEALLR